MKTIIFFFFIFSNQTHMQNVFFTGKGILKSSTFSKDKLFQKVMFVKTLVPFFINI